MQRDALPEIQGGNGPSAANPLALPLRRYSTAAQTGGKQDHTDNTGTGSGRSSMAASLNANGREEAYLRQITRVAAIKGDAK